MHHGAHRAVFQGVIATCLLAAWLPGREAAAGPDDPTVWEYATRCFARIRIVPADLSGPFDCLDGERLPTQVNGRILDTDVCTGASCPTSFPASCDFPAWLGGERYCYGHSYIQVIRPKSNPNVTAALLCRHKLEWTTADDNFDDIAMIVHNEANGETCWFQSPTELISVNLDGRSVPGPTQVTDFWMQPTEAADIGCVQCHDSSPFMVSEWMRRTVKDKLDDRTRNPYKNSEKPFDRWPAPRFVKIGRFGLGQGDRECTSCHKIAAGVTATFELEGIDPTTITTRTCSQWIDWATGALAPDGKQPIPGQNATRNSRKVWMPDPGNFGVHDHADFERRYRTHVDHLKKCCAAVGLTEPGDPIPLQHCEEHIPKVRDPGGPSLGPVPAGG